MLQFVAHISLSSCNTHTHTHRISPLALSNKANTISALASWGGLLKFVKMLHYFRGFLHLGEFVSVFLSLAHDIMAFVSITFLFIIAFAYSFFVDVQFRRIGSNDFDEYGLMIPFTDSEEDDERRSMYETSSWRYGQLQKALYSVVNTALYGFSNIDSELIDGYSGGILIVMLAMFVINLVLLNLIIGTLPCQSQPLTSN